MENKIQIFAIRLKKDLSAGEMIFKTDNSECMVTRDVGLISMAFAGMRRYPAPVGGLWSTIYDVRFPFYKKSKL